MPYVCVPRPSPGLAYFDALPATRSAALPSVLQKLPIPAATAAFDSTVRQNSRLNQPTRIYIPEEDRELVFCDFTLVDSSKCVLSKVYNFECYGEPISFASVARFQATNTHTFMYETSSNFLGSQFTLDSSLHSSKTEEESEIFGPWQKRDSAIPPFDPVNVRALVVILKRLMVVYLADGRDFLLRVPFPVSAMQSLDIGILLEAQIAKRAPSIFETNDEDDEDDIPRLYSTTSPLQDLRPVGGIGVKDRLVWASGINNPIAQGMGLLVTVHETERSCTLWSLKKASDVVEPRSDKLEDYDSTKEEEITFPGISISGPDASNTVLLEADSMAEKENTNVMNEHERTSDSTKTNRSNNKKYERLDIQQHFFRAESDRENARFQFMCEKLSIIHTDDNYAVDQIAVTHVQKTLVITTPTSTHTFQVTFAIPDASDSNVSILPEVKEVTSSGPPSLYGELFTSHGRDLLRQQRSRPDIVQVLRVDGEVEAEVRMWGEGGFERIQLVECVDYRSNEGSPKLQDVISIIKQWASPEDRERLDAGGVNSWDTIWQVCIGDMDEEKEDIKDIWTQFLTMDAQTYVPKLSEKLQREDMLTPLHHLLQESLLFESHQPFAEKLTDFLLDLSKVVGWRDWWEYYLRLGGKQRYIGPWGTSKIIHNPPPDGLNLFRAILDDPGSVLKEGMDWIAAESKLRDVWLSMIAMVSQKTRYQGLVAMLLILDQRGWTSLMVEDLCPSLRAFVQEVLFTLRYSPPSKLNFTAAGLLHREDLQMTAPDLPLATDYRNSWLFKSPWRLMEKKINICTIAHLVDSKTTDTPSKDSEVTNTRFSKDRRMEEVARMLQYIDPVILNVPALQSDHNITARTNAYLSHLSQRTLSLPTGFAMYAFRSRFAPSEGMVDKIVKAPICLSARILPGKSVTKYDEVNVKREWPTFHHGVAIALMSIYPADMSDIPVTCLQGTGDRDPSHGGIMLGMGLTGIMRRMTKFQAFRHLTEKDNFTTVGVLLGLSASHVGTESPDGLSVLLPFMPAFHPPDSIASGLSPVVQSSALLGLGLLYLGSGKKRFANTMLKILGGITLSTTYNADACTEAYALSAGLAFGMIMVAKGSRIEQPGDVGLLKTFKKLIGDFEYSPILDAKKKPDSVIDINITSPAATIALGLMYFDTGRYDIINILEIPDSRVRLDYVGVELILLRTLARHLIMWNDIVPAMDWIETTIPPLLTQDSIWRNTELLLANWAIKAGGAFAVGLKFAGTGNGSAFSTLKFMRDFFLRQMPQIRGRSLDATIRRQFLRTCANVSMISLSLVMAGTGNIDVLKKLREQHGIVGEMMTHGQHVANHISVGLLFLGAGRYTVGTSPASIAVLITALFPIFPKDPGDNRAYIQAYRHLWVLAAEPRYIITKDTEEMERSSIPIVIYKKNGSALRGNWPLLNPIPELQEIQAICINSFSHFDNCFVPDLNVTNKHVYQSFLTDRTIYATKKNGRDSVWLPGLDSLQLPDSLDVPRFARFAAAHTEALAESRSDNEPSWPLGKRNATIDQMLYLFKRCNFVEDVLRQLLGRLTMKECRPTFSILHDIFAYIYEFNCKPIFGLGSILQVRHRQFLLELYVARDIHDDDEGELNKRYYDRHIRNTNSGIWGNDNPHDELCLVAISHYRKLKRFLQILQQPMPVSTPMGNDFLSFLNPDLDIQERYPENLERRMDLLGLIWDLHLPDVHTLDGIQKAVNEYEQQSEQEWNEEMDYTLAKTWGMAGPISMKILRAGWQVMKIRV